MQKAGETAFDCLGPFTTDDGFSRAHLFLRKKRQINLVQSLVTFFLLLYKLREGKYLCICRC